MHETKSYIQVLNINETFILFQNPKYNKLYTTIDKGIIKFSRI